jgi:acetolactate synthase-1/2/3 large subunit
MIDDDIDKPRLPYWNYRVDTRIPGDIETNLIALASAIRQTLATADDHQEEREARRRALSIAHQNYVKEYEKESATARTNSSITAIGFCEILYKLLPRETLIVDETVCHSGLVQHCLGHPGHYVKVGSGGLGIGTGFAIGAKLAQPNRPVVFLVGDGTYTYNPALAALGACQEYNLPLLTVIMDNGGYGAIRGAYQRYRPTGWAVKHEIYPGSDFIPRPNYAAIATGFGGLGIQVNYANEAVKSIRRALAQLAKGKSVIIHVRLAK